MAGPLDLVPANDRVVTAQAPQSSISPQQVASPYRELANNLDRIGEVTDTAAVQAAEVAGTQAVTRDADGTLQIQKQPIIGPASGAFARAARLTYLAQTEPEIENKMAESRIKHANDPAGFQEWSKTYLNEMLAKVPDQTLRGPVQKIIDGNAGQHYRALLNQADQTNVQNTLVSLKSRISDASNKLADLAFQGGTDTEEYKTLQGNVSAMYGELGTDARMGYPKARIDSELTEMSSQHKVMALSGQAIRMMDSESPTARADAKKFLIDKIYGDAGLNLTMSQRHQAVTTAMGLMEARSSENKALIAANSAQVTTLLSGLKTNQPYNMMAVNDAISNAARLGDAESYYKLTFARGMHDWDQTVRGLPLPQQMAALTSLDNMRTPFESRLAGSESSGNPTKVNQLGYAGLYQFGAPRLADLGIYAPGPNENLKDWSKSGRDAVGKWTGTFNVPGFPDVKTLPQFLANPAAQQAAYAAHQGKMDTEIKTLGLDKYEGQTVGGETINRSALYGMMHLGGAQGAADALASGGANAARDANGTSVMDYAKRFAAGGAGQAWFDEARLEQVGRFRGYLKTQATEYVTTAEKMLNKTGDLPDAMLGNIANVLRETDSDDLRKRMDVALMAHYGVKELDALPLSVRQAWVTQAVPQAKDSVVAFQVHEHMAAQIAANAKAMTETPYSTYAVRTNAKPPPVYNFEDPANVAAVAKSRAGTQAAIVANDRTGPMSVFEGKEGEAFGNLLTNGDPAKASQALAGLSGLDTEAYQATLSQKPVKDAVVGMMGSRESVRLMGAVDAIDRFFQKDPAGAVQAFGEKTIEKYQAAKGLIGRTPVEIAEQLNPADSNSVAKARKDAKEAAETEMKGLSPGDVAYRLGTGWYGIGRLTGNTPAAPADPLMADAMRNDYLTGYSALRAYGVQPDQASELTKKNMSATWAVSAAAGNQLMKNAPEQSSQYPSIGGSKDWMADNLNQFITERRGASSESGISRGDVVGSGIPIQRWSLNRLVSDGQTAAEMKAGRPPSYGVIIKRRDGTLDLLEDRIQFDPREYQAKNDAAGEQRRQAADFLSTGQFANAMPQP